MADWTPPSAGWEAVDETTETVFELGAVRVTGTTSRYEDTATRVTLREATHGAVDRPIRFIGVTALSVEPSLPPGGLSAVSPLVRSKAVAVVKQRLRDRGLTAVESRRRDQRRIAGASVQLTTLSAVDPGPDPAPTPDTGQGEQRDQGGELPIEAWVAVWTDDQARVVTGGYPAAPVAEVFDTALEDATGAEADADAETDAGAEINTDVLCRSRSAYRAEFLTALETLPA